MIRHFLLWFAALAAGLVTIVLIADILELIRRAASRPDVGFVEIIAMALLKMPNMLQQFLPFAVLFGAMISFWKLTRSSELVVLRASGISVWQFLRPVILIAFIIGLLKILLLSPISAMMLTRFDTLEGRYFKGQVSQLSVSASGLWLRQSNPVATGTNSNAIIHAARIDQTTLLLDNVNVFMFDNDRFSGRIDAPNATLEDGYWQLTNARISKVDRAPEHQSTLQLPTDLTLKKIQDSFAAPETLSFFALPGFINLLEKAGFSAIRHKLFFQSLLASPFYIASMILLAGVFCLKPTMVRSGLGPMAFYGCLSGFMLYFFSDLIYAQGVQLRIPILLSAWAPAIIASLMSITALLHQEDG